jgi:hypothetical protein
MYAILVKNTDNSWDVIDLYKKTEPDVILDEALQSGLPIVGMEATSHRKNALKGAIWDGTSFSGGTASSEGPSNDDDEFWNSVKRYVFLCDNKVVLGKTVSVLSANVEMFDAAFSSEVTVVKVPDNQVVYVGETYGWNGTEFTNA